MDGRRRAGPLGCWPVWDSGCAAAGVLESGQSALTIFLDDPPPSPLRATRALVSDACPTARPKDARGCAAGAGEGDGQGAPAREEQLTSAHPWSDAALAEAAAQAWRPVVHKRRT